MSEREMRALVELLAKRFGLTWMDVTDWLRTLPENSLDAIEERILSGRPPIAKLDDAARRVAAEIQAGYVTAAEKEAGWLDAKVPGELIAFDPNQNPIVARARANQLELVRGFQQEAQQVARQVTRRAIVEGAQGGINPRQVARDFKDSIGLTPYQESIVANYRRSLESGDYTRALGYELSDGNADRTVRAARRAKKPMTPAQIDQAVDKYRKNAVAHRAATIARTEALRNANEGSADAMRQAIARGQVDAEELITTWHAGPRTRGARDSHQAMDERTVKFGEDFVLPGGVRMAGPGDPRGGAAQNANCRCATSTSFRD